MRAALWDVEHPDDPSDPDHLRRLREHYASAFAADRVRGLVAEVDGEIVGIVSLVIVEHPPRKREPERRGWVTDMFVIESARRRGHARALMEALIDLARAEGVRRLVLRSTDHALPLYRSLAFQRFETLVLTLSQ